MVTSLLLVLTFIKITRFFLPVLVLVDPPLLFLLLLMDNERLLKLLLLLQLIIIILLLNLCVVCFSLSLSLFFFSDEEKRCDNETKIKRRQRDVRFPDFHPFSWFKKKERFSSQVSLSHRVLKFNSLSSVRSLVVSSELSFSLSCV